MTPDATRPREAGTDVEPPVSRQVVLAPANHAGGAGHGRGRPLGADGRRRRPVTDVGRRDRAARWGLNSVIRARLHPRIAMSGGLGCKSLKRDDTDWTRV